MKAGKPNSLINESSPYLLQHAYNPVDWIPWSDNLFEEAKDNDKLIIVSIGYSACHWCHVMEHESFEDTNVAQLMNEHFINVKVDREERPDVDNLYMTAVQLMSGHGGWPLNCILLPDGRPVYGGTYFPKEQWVNVLNNLTRLKTQHPDKLEEYARNLTDGIKQTEMISIERLPDHGDIDSAIRKSVANWKTRFDKINGGTNRAPKFPMPNNYLFLLRYAHLYNDLEVQEHVYLTLNKMACGGIYDQLHGGFARYSTDGIWKLPHFEKMLYDNAQLITLYSEAYQLSRNELYKEIAIETTSFVIRNWYNDEGYFYSAFDADSEGEEGKYYVWSKDELQGILNDDFELFADYFSINENGYWEDGNYILMRSENLQIILSKYDLTLEELNEKINSLKAILQDQAKDRIKPGLDDKSICSWNSLMITALIKAAQVFDREDFRIVAKKCGQFLISKRKDSNNELSRIYKNGKSSINGFLDDYAFSIEALLLLFESNEDFDFLEHARQLTNTVLAHFSIPDSELFYFSHKTHDKLLTRQAEVSDNVIPASNSQMASNLYMLGKLTGDSSMIGRAERMTRLFLDEFIRYGTGYSNWGNLGLLITRPFFELVIVGKHVDEIIKGLRNHYLTNTILVVSKAPSDFPMFKGRYKEGENLIYVCRDNTCQLPVDQVELALKLLDEE